ncbi:hypothetical protein [Nonomuraea sp. NPDC050643]|uniref:hypothetical protein n=1 Tax=Nonomuraea sp. NPDC050643 TaxID=3155660 RepID=UPI0033E2C5F4
MKIWYDPPPTSSRAALDLRMEDFRNGDPAQRERAARDHACVERTKSRAAADLIVEATGTATVMSGPPKRNGWMIDEWMGDRGHDATQRLLNRAGWTHQVR